MQMLKADEDVGERNPSKHLKRNLNSQRRVLTIAVFGVVSIQMPAEQVINHPEAILLVFINIPCSAIKTIWSYYDAGLLICNMFAWGTSQNLSNCNMAAGLTAQKQISVKFTLILTILCTLSQPMHSCEFSESKDVNV